MQMGAGLLATQEAFGDLLFAVFTGKHSYFAGYNRLRSSIGHVHFDWTINFKLLTLHVGEAYFHY
jgi:hypothetical protein